MKSRTHRHREFRVICPEIVWLVVVDGVGGECMCVYLSMLGIKA